MTLVDEDILIAFLGESLDTLTEWERCCMQLQENSLQNEHAIAQLFRCAHNMKGSAKSVGLAHLGQFIHAVEDVVLRLKNKTLLPSQKVTSTLLQCKDFLLLWIKKLKTNASYVPANENILARVKALLEDQPKSQTKSEASGTSYIAALEGAKEGDIVFISEEAEDQKSDLSGSPEDPMQLESESLNEESQTPDQTTENVQQNSREVASTESIRVPAARIDSLIQLVGELSIQASIISHARTSDSLKSGIALDAIDLLAKITRELQTSAMGFRMQTLRGTMQRLERVARDVAGELGKEIEIMIDGMDVELDKTVIERMTDPLVHMVRNAIDHGIETPAERSQTSKRKCGKVMIEARQAPEGVTLVLTDDGKGLDSAKILAKAQSQGLVGKDKKLTQQDIFGFIFAQGFSTAQQVTGISGRGVGMEVVQCAVNELGGQILIESTIGKGTSFSITLPSSVSIVDALIVYISKNRYAVPLAQVEEILNSKDLVLEKSTNNQTLFRLREEYLPYRDLRLFMKDKTQSSTKQTPFIASKPEDNNNTILVVRHGNRRLGLCVDAITGQQQIVVRKLSGVLDALDGFVGGTILGDGEPGFIVDIPYWASKFLNQKAG